MFTIIVHFPRRETQHDYRPHSLAEAQAVAQELSRDFSGTLVSIHRPAFSMID